MTQEMRLASLERTQWVILSFLALGSLAFWDWRITLGVIIGGVIIIVNFKALRRIVERGFSEGGVSKSFLLKYALKFLFLLAAVAGVAFLLQGVINLVAFLVGLLTIFLAILAEGMRGYRYTNEETDKTDGT
ncbi:MAG: ATP synthase subunit I [Deltaproteobacteria bacterium]|nr:MAG: ATP synthase subunit I [Deltaproteobacteria bacterium]